MRSLGFGLHYSRHGRPNVVEPIDEQAAHAFIRDECSTGLQMLLGAKPKALYAMLARHRELGRRQGREEAAKACEDQRDAFLSPEYATGQPMSSVLERLACAMCATAIRQLGKAE